MWHVLLFLVYSTSARAKDSCSTIDLSHGAGAAYKQIDTSWCHIFTTTDTFARHLRNKRVLKAGERLHPLQFAAAPPIENGRSVVNSTDHLSNMFKDMRALSEVTAHPADVKPGDSPRLNEGLCADSDLAKQNPRALALFNQDWRKAKRMFDATDCFVKYGCSRNVPPSAPIREICDQISGNERKYWYDLFRKNCHRAWPDWYVEWNHQKSRFDRMKDGGQLKPKTDDLDNFLKASVDAALDEGEFAAIGYDASFLLKGATNGESHWSSIVGRKRGPDGKCYYGVRNSWGADCRGYSSSVQCMKNGLFLVSEDELLPRIHTVQRFTDPKPVLVQPASFKGQ